MLQFLRDNALFVAAGWLAFGFLVALWFSRMAAHGEREVPVVYDWRNEEMKGQITIASFDAVLPTVNREDVD